MNYRYIIFDLDQTLYPKSSGMLQAIDDRIDQYISDKLHVASKDVSKLRHEYWKKYGTTIGGLILHHQVDPADYMAYAYQIEVESYICPNPHLVSVLANIPLERIVFSNSPYDYVQKVLEVLGIAHLFTSIYDIAFCDYLGKPNLSSYAEVLHAIGAEGKECIFVDDVPVNVTAAEKAGMTGVLLGTESISDIAWRIEDILDVGNVMKEIEHKRRSA